MEIWRMVPVLVMVSGNSCSGFTHANSYMGKMEENEKRASKNLPVRALSEFTKQLHNQISLWCVNGWL